MNLSPAGAHLLDTSAIVLLMRCNSTASHEALVPFAALGELNAGVFKADHQEREAARIRMTIDPATTILPTRKTAVQYGRITAHLQRTGRMIPVNDVWIAAQALELDLPLLGDDAHFHRVPGLRFIPVR